MSEHVLDWLNAYADGELRGGPLRRVEAHLRDCAACQAELTALRALSAHLQLNPAAPARTPPEQFVAQVRLRLPARSPAGAGRRQVRQAAGLYLPLGVLALWAFGQAVLAVGAVALVAAPQAAAWRWLSALSVWLLPAELLPAGWGSAAVLLALSVGLTAAMAGLLWSCLAGWWAARDTGETLAGAPLG